MVQLGSIKVMTSNGAIEVPLFEPSDVDLPVWSVQTEAGTGVVNLTDPQDAELSQVRVSTSNGVKAVSTTLSGSLSFQDDFTTNTLSEYDFTLSSGSPSYSYSSSNDAVFFNTTDNDYIEMERSFADMPSTGYVKIINDITGDDPYGETVDLSIMNSSTGNRYRITNRDGSYTEGLYKTVNGSNTDSFTQNGSSNHSRRTIELWWSPTHLKVAFNGTVQWDVDTTDTTDISPDSIKIVYRQINSYLEYIEIDDSKN